MSDNDKKTVTRKINQEEYTQRGLAATALPGHFFRPKIQDKPVPSKTPQQQNPEKAGKK